MTMREWLPRPQFDTIVAATWKHMSDAGGGLMIVSGPVGVGKTTTARRLSPRWVVSATSPSLEPPLGLWTRLATLLRHDGVATPDVFHRNAHHDLADAARHEAVTGLLASLASCGRAEVMFDDLHGADASSLTALAQVVPTLNTLGVRMVATSRGADAHPVPLARRAHRIVDRHASSLALEPLSADELEMWLRHLLPDQASAPVAEALHRATGGTPLAVAHVMAWARHDPRPLSVVLDGLDRSPLRPAQHLWVSVIGDVHPRAQLALAIIVALGDRADVDLLAATLSVTPEVAADDVNALNAHGLVRRLDADRLTASHPSIAEAITARGPWLTHEHHRRLADSLADSHLPADAEPRRRHLTACGALATSAELVSAALHSAKTAAAWGDTATAASAWAQVVDLDDAPEFLIECARAHRRAGQRQVARRFALQATAACDQSPVLFARAALLAADGSEFHGDAWSAVALLENALHGLRLDTDTRSRHLRVEVLGALADLEMTLPLDGPTPRLADLVHRPTHQGSAVMWQWITQPERAQPRAMTAEDEAAELGDTRLMALTGLRWRNAHQSPVHRSGRLLRSTAARHTLVDPLERADAVRAHLLDALEGGDHVTVEAALADLEGTCRRVGDSALAWRLAHTRAMLARARGAASLAEQFSEEAFLLGRLSDEPTAVVVRAEQWAVNACDRLDRVPQVLAAGRDYRALRHPPVLAGALALTADLATAGFTEAAVDAPLLAQLVDHLRTSSSHEQNWMITAAFTARAVWSTSAVELAAPMLGLLEPWTDLVARESSGIVCDGFMLRHVASMAHLLGRDATDLVAEAITRDRDAGFERSALCGELDLLAMRAITGALDPRQVRAAAEQIEHRCREMGLLCLAAHASRMGSRLLQVALTERQHLILELLAQGSTYQYIADTIGFSHGTVRAEVSRLYDLLGCDNRRDALAEARWRGLVSSPSVG